MAFAACGDGGDAPAPGPPADLVELRSVESTSPVPCADGAFELEAECLVLGPVAVDARDIRTAESIPAQPNGRSLSIELTASGEERFNGLATGQLGRRIAVLVDGVVVSAPTVHGTSFTGSVTITGLSDEQLRRVTEGFAASDGS